MKETSFFTPAAPGAMGDIQMKGAPSQPELHVFTLGFSIAFSLVLRKKPLSWTNGVLPVGVQPVNDEIEDGNKMK